jgi:hypothetical protein
VLRKQTVKGKIMDFLGFCVKAAVVFVMTLVVIDEIKK